MSIKIDNGSVRVCVTLLNVNCANSYAFIIQICAYNKYR